MKHHHHHQHFAAHHDEGHRGGHRGGPRGGDELMRGRKFSSDDLQLMLLSLLAEGPRHGYDLIKLLGERSEGFYSPSPGMVYPALTYIHELDMASVALDGNKKSYSLAPAGQAHLDSMKERAAELMAMLAHMGRKMAHMRGAMAEEGGEPAAGAWLPEFVDARRALKRALLMKSNADHVEQRRIAAILARATLEIDAAAPLAEN